jgi:hypothetical protein
MADCVKCPDEPRIMLTKHLCLSAISKNLEGDIGEPQRDRRECQDPPCVTLATIQPLRLEVHSHDPCDSDRGRLFDGTLEVTDLVHNFEGDGTGRGFHSGDFRWQSPAALAFGRLSGMTNVGTHRGPVFDECQPCDAKGFMEGQFCGSIQWTEDKSLLGCNLFGTYRLRCPDTARDGFPAQKVAGTLEGVTLCRCGG